MMAATVTSLSPVPNTWPPCSAAEHQTCSGWDVIDIRAEVASADLDEGKLLSHLTIAFTSGSVWQFDIPAQGKDSRCAICTSTLLADQDRPDTPREWEHWLATTRKTIDVVWDTANPGTAASRLIHLHCTTRASPQGLLEPDAGRLARPVPKGAGVSRRRRYLAEAVAGRESAGTSAMATDVVFATRHVSGEYEGNMLQAARHLQCRRRAYSAPRHRVRSARAAPAAFVAATVARDACGACGLVIAIAAVVRDAPLVVCEMFFAGAVWVGVFDDPRNRRALKGTGSRRFRSHFSRVSSRLPSVADDAKRRSQAKSVLRGPRGGRA
jgi:hypothetical protein